jgi:hypothetical protein
MSTGSAKRMLGLLNRAHPPTKPEAITDDFQTAVIRTMQERGIVNGVINDDGGEPHADKVLRVLREDQEWQAQYEAERAQREAEQAEAAMTLPELLTRAISGSNSTSGPMPLNGPRVLLAALGGESGTINGKPA